MSRSLPSALLALSMMVLAGCGGSSSSGAAATTPSHGLRTTSTGSSAPSPPEQSPSHTTSPPATSSGAATSSGTATSSGVAKLLVFVVENHSLSEMRDQMPWTFALGQHYGYATDFHAMTHPSLPNYLAIAGGSTFGVTDDADPTSHPISGPSVFGEALAHGLTARVYADAMPAACFPTSAGEYAVRHNPWTYFVDERSQCQTYDTPLARFADDVRSGQLPDAGLVVPDVCHDAHNCSLSTADAWMRQYVGLAMSGPDFSAGRLAVVVTADEDDGSQGNVVLTIVADPSLHGVVTSSPLSQLSLSRLYSEVLGLPPLREAASAPSMSDAFGLTLARRSAQRRSR